MFCWRDPRLELIRVDPRLTKSAPTGQLEIMDLRPRALRALFAAFVVSAVLGLTEHASAQPAVDQQARTHFEAGTQYYAAGRFADAAREFEQAYEMSHRPALLHNLYLARRDNGDQRGAADALRRYLAEANDIQPANRALLQSRLEALDRTVAEQDAAAAAAADAAEAAATANSASQGAANESDEAGGMGIIPGISVTSAGGAILIVSLVQSIRARGTRSDYDALCASSGTPGSCLASDEARLSELESDFNRQRNSAWGLMIGGAVTAGAGAALWILGGRSGDDAPSTTADVACGPTGCTAVVRGSF